MQSQFSYILKSISDTLNMNLRVDPTSVLPFLLNPRRVDHPPEQTGPKVATEQLAHFYFWK